MNSKPVVVLAFSGGLDTSYCAASLGEHYRVHSVIVDTGGFSAAELRAVEEAALQLGVEKHTVLDETDAFYRRCLRYLVFGNVLRNNTYPLSVSAERVFQAVAIARYAREIGADAVAHGSTGAGNDQVRFDIAFNVLLPGVPVITPIRDNKLAREDEISFLRGIGVERNWDKALYSINKGLWGTTIGGRETLGSDGSLPEEAFPTPVAKTQPETVALHFTRGELAGINGEELTPVEAIRRLTDIAQPFGIGRDIHVGDTVIGLKGRVGFEAAAPLIIIRAHHALEKHTLTRHQLALKEQLAAPYGAMLHEGQFLEPAMRNIEVFLESTQRTVTGVVKVYLAPYRFHITGVVSDYDMMSPAFGSYGEMNNAWTGDDVRGFSRIASNQTMMYYSVNGHE